MGRYVPINNGRKRRLSTRFLVFTIRIISTIIRIGYIATPTNTAISSITDVGGIIVVIVCIVIVEELLKAGQTKVLLDEAAHVRVVDLKAKSSISYLSAAASSVNC